DAGDHDVVLRATIDNRGKEALSGYVVFTAAPQGSDTPEFRSGDIAFQNIGAYAVQAVYCGDWTPQRGTTYTITAELHETGGRLVSTLSSAAVINSPPYSHAGADITDAVMGQGVRFDGSRSYDADGYIASFVWDFGDGESGYGPTPTHVYLHAGTYRVGLTVSDSNLTYTEPYRRNPVTDEIVESTRTEYNYFSEIQVTVNADCPDLFISALTFSDDAPDKGDTVTVTATVQNGTLPNTGGLTSTGADAHYLVGFYLNDRYLGFAELTGDLAVGATTTASIDFTALSGAQKVSAVVNDIGRNVREVNYDNNRFDRVLSGSETDFADLAVTSFRAALTDGDTISWGEAVTVNAAVRNGGSSAAEAFKVLLYDNGKLVASRMVDGLAAGAEAALSFTWRPEQSGAHDLTLSVDGPVSSVVEMDESNNVETLVYTAITLLYPDLEIAQLTTGLTATALAPGQNVLLYATVKNSGRGDAVLPTRLYFYADSRHIGAADVPALASGESTLVTFVWKDPALSVSTLTAVADAGEALAERSEGNNAASHRFDVPIKVATAA
ncbi:MAG: PKD domain-containing protein, partial [Oscillibacter sp.]|nr:PKD domain-containing protein [Oscillibacter sp.]